MTISERTELAKFLRHGDKVKIAKLASVHINTLKRWLKGELDQSIVEPFFQKFAESRKKEFDELTKDM